MLGEFDGPSPEEMGIKPKVKIQRLASEYGLYDKKAGEKLQQGIEHTNVNLVANYFRARADVFREKKEKTDVKATKLFDGVANALSAEKPNKSDLQRALQMIEEQYDRMQKMNIEDTEIWYGDRASMDAMRHYLKSQLEDQSGKYTGMSDKEMEERKKELDKIKVR